MQKERNRNRKKEDWKKAKKKERKSKDRKYTITQVFPGKQLPLSDIG